MATTQIVSYSEIDTARQCFLKHRWSYKERWVGISKSPALSRGTLWHKVLEDFYLVILFFQQIADGKWEPAFPAVKVGDDLILEEAFKAGMAHLVNPAGNYLDEDADLIGWMFTGYVELYGIDPNWKILGVEQAMEFWLPTERGGRSRFKVKMKLDLVVRDLELDRRIVVDHKSGKNLPYSKELDVDDQFGLYVWGMRQAKVPVFGAVHSAARTQRNKNQDRFPQALEERFKRTPLYRTDTELNAVAVDAYRSAKAAYGFKPGEEPRSPNTDTCRWKCDYLEVCLGTRKGMPEKSLLNDFGFEQNFQRH